MASIGDPGRIRIGEVEPMETRVAPMQSALRMEAEEQQFLCLKFYHSTRRLFRKQLLYHETYVSEEDSWQHYLLERDPDRF